MDDPYACRCICSEECSYTSSIDHAKNFNKEYGIYIEEY